MAKSREAGPLSGFRDILAEQKIPRDHMISTIKGVYEGYGFTPLDTPIVERQETLSGKYGDEGEQLMYKFTDHGDRLLALRYDLTVPLARVVGQHRDEITLPYKRYQIGPVFRGESPQAGRYREFVQFDADTVGTNSVLADAEVVAMMSDTMDALGADALIRVNNRLLLDALVTKAGIQEPTDARALVGTIDKVEKIGKDAALASIAERFNQRTAALVSEFLTADGNNQDRLKNLDALLKGEPTAEEGISNLLQVFGIIEAAGYKPEQITFDQTIARGLNYYTGIIYETSLKAKPEIGSVCSGGRYDNLVKDLGGPDLPAVGTSVGVDRLFTALSELGQLETAKTTSEAMIVNFGTKDGGVYMKVAAALRKAGIPTEIHLDEGKVGKQLKFANKMGIPYVVMMGSNELESNTAMVKNMDSGEQMEVPMDQVSDYINSQKNAS